MDLFHVKEGDTIIAPTYLHEAIRKQLVHDKNGVSNITIQSLPHFLKVESTPTQYAYYTKLQSLRNQLNHLKDSVLSLSFINELNKVITHMKQFDISWEAIQEQNEIKKELKLIIASLYDIPLAIDQMKQQLANVGDNLSHVTIIDYYSESYEHFVLQQLQSKKAHLLCPKKTEHINKQWYYALNKRCEVESIAQYIIEHKIHAKDIKFTLLDSTYIPYIHLLFPQYNIPYQLTSDSERSFIQNKFIALLQYYQNPTWETSIDLIAAHLFALPNAKQAMDYMSLYELDLHDDFHIVSKVAISNDVVDEREVKRLRLLEEKALETQAALLPFLFKMEACTSLIDVLCFIDDFLIQTHDFKTNQDRKTILRIRQEIKAARFTLKTKEDIPFFIANIEAISIAKDNDVEGIQISDLCHPLPFAKYHFMLGATQENYPAMQANEGLFDEQFYEDIHYPSLQQRYQLHLQYVSKQLTSSEHIIASYPLSSFDGKAQEASLELEQFFDQEAQKLTLIENYTNYARTYSISSESAKQLFIEDNILKGSVSSLERYANCPYSYFLRYGLKIDEPIDYTFSNAKAGTLNHFILETLCTMYGKQYVDTKKAEVQALLEQKMRELIDLYPNKQKQLLQMQERLLTSLMQNLAVLKDHELHSSLQPTQLEQQIAFTIPFDEQYELKLKGFIDRIDTNNDFFRIIDYKSSPKSLKEEYVFSALQLQLITYLVIIEKQSNLRPLGAFYYSFANPNINMSYAKLKRRPLGYELFKEKDGDLYLLKEKKLAGWITSEYIEVMDDEGSHIKGVRNSKASGINTSTIYNPETLYDYMMRIYQQLAHAITNGEIPCKSVSGACTYCPYASICANANHTYTKEEMVEVEEALYLKGGRKNA